jgi:hypothetical protein
VKYLFSIATLTVICLGSLFVAIQQKEKISSSSTAHTNGEIRRTSQSTKVIMVDAQGALTGEVYTWKVVKSPFNGECLQSGVSNTGVQVSSSVNCNVLSVK